MEPDVPSAADLLPISFFERDPRAVALDLLGCAMLTFKDDLATGGIIVETEAYLGADDEGSHAATRGVTARNAVMYGPPGYAYVYLAYGMHHLFNVVCGPEGTAGAVLVRALEPVWGVPVMESRRGPGCGAALANGPGRLTRALGIGRADNATPLSAGGVALFRAPRPVGPVAVSGRIGLAAGTEHEYRYYVGGSPFVSRARVKTPARACGLP
ncbi:MAG TPA: DNA-3-methyladenine glycosylase [Coriobacteriia bacterium]|nr:DNA-3-methyladenine glycosylase [Coriobacteriia bacterium]